jgi:hypothetical protein
MLVALRVGVAILGAGQTIWAAMRSPLICIIVASLLAVPATIAGYHASLGLAAPASVGEKHSRPSARRPPTGEVGVRRLADARQPER